MDVDLEEIDLNAQERKILSVLSPESYEGIPEETSDSDASVTTCTSSNASVSTCFDNYQK